MTRNLPPHLTRKLSVQYKTAWVLLAKIREAIGLRRAKMRLWGSVQIDGKYVGGHIKPENKKSERIDRRKKGNQNGKRVCVMALRENNRHGPNRIHPCRARREFQGGLGRRGGPCRTRYADGR